MVFIISGKKYNKNFSSLIAEIRNRKQKTTTSAAKDSTVRKSETRLTEEPSEILISSSNESTNGGRQTEIEHKLNSAESNSGCVNKRSNNGNDSIGESYCTDISQTQITTRKSRLSLPKITTNTLPDIIEESSSQSMNISKENELKLSEDRTQRNSLDGHSALKSNSKPNASLTSVVTERVNTTKGISCSQQSSTNSSLNTSKKPRPIQSWFGRLSMSQTSSSCSTELKNNSRLMQHNRDLSNNKTRVDMKDTSEYFSNNDDFSGYEDDDLLNFEEISVREEEFYKGYKANDVTLCKSTSKTTSNSGMKKSEFNSDSKSSALLVSGNSSAQSASLKSNLDTTEHDSTETQLVTNLEGQLDTTSDVIDIKEEPLVACPSTSDELPVKRDSPDSLTYSENMLLTNLSSNESSDKLMDENDEFYNAPTQVFVSAERSRTPDILVASKAIQRTKGIGRKCVKAAKVNEGMESDDEFDMATQVFQETEENHKTADEAHKSDSEFDAPTQVFDETEKDRNSNNIGVGAHEKSDGGEKSPDLFTSSDEESNCSFSLMDDRNAQISEY